HLARFDVGVELPQPRVGHRYPDQTGCPGAEHGTDGRRDEYHDELQLRAFRRCEYDEQADQQAADTAHDHADFGAVDEIGFLQRVGSAQFAQVDIASSQHVKAAIV